MRPLIEDVINRSSHTSYNALENKPISVIFGTQNNEKIWRK